LAYCPPESLSYGGTLGRAGFCDDRRKGSNKETAIDFVAASA
jgi:hypothetical protein